MFNREISTYADALRNAQTTGRPLHLLVGNGFSRALRNDIFSYSALFERADFSALPRTARDSFERLETTDFETVMRALKNAAVLLNLYAPQDADTQQRMQSDAGALREVLAATIAQNHPAGPFEVDEHQYTCCRAFLSPYRSIYTLNYDLLLYWSLMHEQAGPNIECDDGFRKPDDPEAPYVTWEVEHTQKQNMVPLRKV